MRAMSRHLAESTTKLEAGFKPNAQLAHDLFEIAATVCTMAQVDEDDIEHLNLICEHAVDGMRLVKAGDEELQTDKETTADQHDRESNE